MTDRKKLIELLTEPLPVVESPLGDEFSPKMKMGLIFAGKVADNLLANGVIIPVRCKDCKHFLESFSGTHSCKLHKGLVGTKYDTFCSYGERKDNDS